MTGRKRTPSAPRSRVPAAGRFPIAPSVCTTAGTRRCKTNPPPTRLARAEYPQETNGNTNRNPLSQTFATAREALQDHPTSRSNFRGNVLFTHFDLRWVLAQRLYIPCLRECRCGNSCGIGGYPTALRWGELGICRMRAKAHRGFEVGFRAKWLDTPSVGVLICA